MNQFSGSIIGLDWISDLLGSCPILVLHPWLVTALNLTVPNLWQQQLALTNNVAETAAVFRSWRVRTVGDQIGEENVIYEGCDLVIEPNVFEEMVKQVQIVPRFVRHINRTDELS